MEINVGLLMMVKNEEKRIETSLSSVLGVIKNIVIYDTGSTDNTINIIEKFCKKNHLNLYLKKGEFVDFSTSRNESLKFAEEQKHIHYLLLLDGNDELKGANKLKKLAELMYNRPESGFLMCQEWLNANNSITKYFNIRFIKNNFGWRYNGSVHEYIYSDHISNGTYRVDDSIKIFQDRKYDVEKSMSRYKKDKELLLKDYSKDPKNGRTLFYLAQTCSCLGENEESLKYYTERSSVDEFLEEKFHSFLRCGEIREKLGMEWSQILSDYLSAYNIIPRAEPLVKIADHYRHNKKWGLSYFFIKKACDLNYPTNCNLFVDRYVYDYQRWHLMGIVAYYSGNFQEGYEGCKKALEYGKFEIDKNNIKFYEEKLKK